MTAAIKPISPGLSPIAIEAIERAEEIIEVAKRGELIGFAMLYTDKDGNINHKCMFPRRLEAMGAIEALKLETWTD